MSKRTGKAFRYVAALSIVCALSLLTAQPSHGQKPPDPKRKPTPLRVGAAADYRPLVFKENGKIVGIEADFAENLSKELGIAVDFVEVPWTDLIPALREHRIDVIMSGMSVTDERSELVSFADPYMQVGQMALIRRQDVDRLRDPAAMQAEGVRVGVQEKTTGEAFAHSKLKRAKVVAFASIEEAIQALRKGDLDFVVHDAPTIWGVVGRPGREDPDLVGLYRPLTDEYLAWAVGREDEGLRKRLNSALAKWRESGQLDHILDRWVTIRKMTVEISPK
jgi:ABC-type amino acid transport substrate-binding protein